METAAVARALSDGMTKARSLARRAFTVTLYEARRRSTAIAIASSASGARRSCSACPRPSATAPRSRRAACSATRSCWRSSPRVPDEASPRSRGPGHPRRRGALRSCPRTARPGLCHDRRRPVHPASLRAAPRGAAVPPRRGAAAARGESGANAHQLKSIAPSPVLYPAVLTGFDPALYEPPPPPLGVPGALWVPLPPPE